MVAKDCDTQIENTSLPLLSNFTHLNYVVNKYNPGWIYPWSRVYSRIWRKEVRAEMFAGMTNTLLGGDKGARKNQEYFIFKRKTKKERKIMVMSPIKFHSCVITKKLMKGGQNSTWCTTLLQLKLQGRVFFPCINFFFQIPT